jgi:hypothetical protein
VLDDQISELITSNLSLNRATAEQQPIKVGNVGDQLPIATGSYPAS